MSAYDRGDVVLVTIDFTDGSGANLRPAVVVSSEDYNRNSPDVLIASITSNRNALPHPGDHHIKEWKTARLLKPSLVQTKIATIEASVIRRKLGTLEAEDLEVFEDGLRKALDLRCPDIGVEAEGNSEQNEPPEETAEDRREGAGE